MRLFIPVSILRPTMAAKLNPNILYVREPRESLTSQDSDRLAQAEAGEESSDSDGEQEETSHRLIRKVSTSGQIRAKVGYSYSLVGRALTIVDLSFYGTMCCSFGEFYYHIFSFAQDSFAATTSYLAVRCMPLSLSFISTTRNFLKYFILEHRHLA